MNALGDKIKKLRQRENIQQNDFAKKIGVSNVVLSRYESGERKPDYEVLQKIASYFDVSTDYLLGQSDNPRMTAEEEFQAFANDPELGRWYRELPESNEEDLQKLRQMWEIIKSDKKRK